MDDITRLELEAGILGGLIAKSAECGQWLPELSAEDFSDGLNRDLFGAVKRLFLKSAPIDRITIADEMGGDSDALLRYIDACVDRAASDMRYYSERLHEKRLLEDVQKAATGLVYATDTAQLPSIIDRLNGLLVTKQSRQGQSMADAVQQFFDRHSGGKKPEYLEWGMNGLNRRLFCAGGDFVAIGGYPSSGKTLLALQFALNFAKRGKRVGFFSFETSPEKLTDRMMAHVSHVPLSHIKRGGMRENEWRDLMRTAEVLNDYPLELISAAGMSVSDIRAYSLSRRYDIVFVDYLQLIGGSGHERRSRYDIVTETSIGLHTLAQSTGITVIALAQLSRPDTTKGKPTPPSMASFRESGQIEQDVDVAMILYPENPNDNRGNRILKIAKNKEGERGSLTLAFDGDVQTLRPIREAEEKKPGRPQEAAGQVKFEELPEDGEKLPF